MLRKLERRFWQFVLRKLDRHRQYVNELSQAAILSRAKKLGQGVRLIGSSTITGISEIEFGNNVHIGENAYIRGEGGLIIGDNTHISRNFALYTINHKYQGSRLPYDEGMIFKPVTIGRNVWIGMNVSIAPGTVIGDGAIIGIGTTLFGSIPKYAVVGSAKWRQLGSRDSAHYHDLDDRGQYCGINGRPLIDMDANRT